MEQKQEEEGKAAGGRQRAQHGSCWPPRHTRSDRAAAGCWPLLRIISDTQLSAVFWPRQQVQRLLLRSERRIAVPLPLTSYCRRFQFRHTYSRS